MCNTKLHIPQHAIYMYLLCLSKCDSVYMYITYCRDFDQILSVI